MAKIGWIGVGGMGSREQGGCRYRRRRDLGFGGKGGPGCRAGLRPEGTMKAIRDSMRREKPG